jgi:beta-lactamase regulating signal transducer with metallopeptidase domain
MAGLSQSAFLQALGWATLNSFWQMALLWCVFLGANYFFKLSAQNKYYLSAGSVIAGALWFFGTFILYYNNYKPGYSFGLTEYAIPSLNNLTPVVLASASIAYLILLIIPAYRLIYNWKSIQLLRKIGLQKAEIHYKLFVKKITASLGIKNIVAVYFSELVKSPLTIGYLKPIILLPLASVNNLTVHQIEAVLLHELSHIKRYDYLVNIFISIIQTFLYFNPFTRLLIRVVQEERENCCDQMVLQFGYDKLSYASALLSLEKTSLQSHVFVLRAAGKRNLLSRIEKIVGVEKKLQFRFNHFAGLIAAFLCLFTFNSLLIISKEKAPTSLSFNRLENPFYFFNDENSLKINSKSRSKEQYSTAKKSERIKMEEDNTEVYIVPDAEIPPSPQHLEDILMPVAYNETASNLSEEQKIHIKSTIENTKKVLGTYQWKEVEKTIGEALSAEEKEAVKQQYLQEINKIDWENMEKGLKTAYENINWQMIDMNLQLALTNIRIDSLKFSYELALKALEKAQFEAEASLKPTQLPLPDASLEELQKRQETLRNSLKEIKLIKNRKVIKL